MKTKFEIKSYLGSILFTYECRSLKEAVVSAVKCGADLRGANLCGANLSEADLSGASLCGADLSGADLRGASLYGANLYGANLCGANLSRASLSKADLCRADLSGANLSEADLSGADLSGANLPIGYRVARLDFGGWSICVLKDKTSIGCQTHPNDDWLKWKPKDVAEFAEGASEWWKQHGNAVKAVIKDVMSK